MTSALWQQQLGLLNTDIVDPKQFSALTTTGMFTTTATTDSPVEGSEGRGTAVCAASGFCGLSPAAAQSLRVTSTVSERANSPFQKGRFITGTALKSKRGAKTCTVKQPGCCFSRRVP